ncbi:hypothetical protein QE152_g13397 [Popillia japonica]|uniref:Uncharacterized protein n=1 Tax=Popillia japonica TaxID=7064 RepID=A0AAW1LD60_POPJA
MEKLRAEDRNRNEIQVALKTGNGFAGISNFLDKTWPRDLYARTRIERVDASNMTSDGDFAFLLDPKCIQESKKMESVMMVYPDIKDFIAKNEGQIDYLIKTVATKTRYQETSEKITGLYFLPIEINKEGVNRMEDIYDIIKSLENIMQVHPTDKLKLLVAEGLNVGYVRKLCEYIFCDTGVSVLLLTTQDESKLTTNKEKRAPTEKVIVKTGNIGYADLLKTVKERVNLNTVGVNIKTIRKTMGGDLMLEVNGDRRKANALREAISSKTIRKTMGGDLMLEVNGDRRKANALREAISSKTNHEAKLVNSMVTIHILDIDAATTEKEVEASLKDTLGNHNPQSLTIKPLRPTRDGNRDGNQISTIQVDRATANLLLRTKKIKIGWVGCRIKERVVLQRCYRCRQICYFEQRKSRSDGLDVESKKGLYFRDATDV